MNFMKYITIFLLALACLASFAPGNSTAENKDVQIHASGKDCEKIPGRQIPLYGFDDVILDTAPDDQGIRAFQELVDILKKILIQSERDRQSRNLLDYLGMSIGSFDFMELVNYPLFTDLPGGYRGVSIHGKNLDAIYRLALSHVPYQEVPLDTNGNFIAEIGLRKNEESILQNRSFSGYLRIKAATRQLSHRNFFAFFNGLLTYIDPANITHLRHHQSPVFENLRGISRPVVDGAYASIPEYATLLDKYIHVDSLLVPKTHENIPYTHSRLRCSFKLEKLAQDYPKIAQTLEKLERVFKIHLVLMTATGKTLTEFYFHGEENYISWDLFSKNGKLVPYDEEGTPCFDEALSLVDTRSYRFRVLGELFQNIHGLKFKTGNVVLQGDYLDKNRHAHLNFKLIEKPETVVYGRGFYIVPRFFIDLVIPGNLDQHIEDFCYVLLRANNDTGTLINRSYDLTDPDQVKTQLLISSEFLDNLFIRFGLKLWQRQVLPGRQTRLEIKNLLVLSLNALEKDLERQKVKYRLEKQGITKKAGQTTPASLP